MFPNKHNQLKEKRDFSKNVEKLLSFLGSSYSENKTNSLSYKFQYDIDYLSKTQWTLSISELSFVFLWDFIRVTSRFVDIRLNKTVTRARH